MGCTVYVVTRVVAERLSCVSDFDTAEITQKAGGLLLAYTKRSVHVRYLLCALTRELHGV